MSTLLHPGPPDAASSVLKRTRACPECGREFRINPCHAEEHRYCRAACRAKAHRQARIPFPSGPAEPLVPLATPKQIRDAHKPTTLAVLRMLQAGPVTTGEFLGACIGRFGARVHELKAVGWAITTAKLSAHSALYTLVGPRDASRGACAEPGCAVCAVEGA